MADFVAILEKAIGSLPENQAEARKAIYAKARSTIERKLRAIEPPPAEEVISRQMTLLEDAVLQVESRHAANAASSTPSASTQQVTPGPDAASAAAPSARLPQDADGSPASSTAAEPAPEVVQEPAGSQAATDPFLSTGAPAGNAPAAAPPAAPPAASEPEESVTRPIEVTPSQAASPEPDPALQAGDSSAPSAIWDEPPSVELPAEPAPPAYRAAQQAYPEGAPPYIADLENEPDAGPPPLAGSDRYPGSGRQNVGNLGSGRQSGGAGKWIGRGVVLLLLGGIATGGYLYRGEISRLGGTLGEAVSAFFGDDTQGGGTTSADTQDPASDGDIKDDARLGQGEEEAPGSQTGEEEAAAGGEQAAAGDGSSGLRDVTPPASGDQPEAGAVVPVEDNPPATDGGTENADGTADAGQADGEQTEPVTAEPADAQDTAQSSVSSVTGEKAYLYEEAAGSAGASRDEAFIGWSIANEPPEAGLPSEPVIKGFMEVPGRGLTMSVSIKRNLDEALPASHLIELVFTAPPEFTGGNVDNISRFVMKGSEQARGESLVGVPARIDTGYFLIALNNLPQAQETNLRLMESAEWIDIPVSYANGRRALVTLEKGPSGKAIFANALADWQNRQ